MSSDAVIEFESVTKSFIDSSRGRWRSAVPGVQPTTVGHPAVNDVSLRVQRGESLGIIGSNGAGKSTLLKLLAGVLAPTSGSVRYSGRIGAMIELGLGFHPALTGRENLTCTGVLLGLDGRAAHRRIDEIVEFAGLVDELDEPLREYSTGMVARLGFAVATHVGADILVVDEVLSVGDTEFQERCLERIRSLVSGGTTLLFVSHELPLVRAACDRAVIMQHGSIVDDGSSSEVTERYFGRRLGVVRESAAPIAIDPLAISPTPLVPGEPVHASTHVTLTSDDAAELTGIDVILGFPAMDPDVVIVRTSCEVPEALRSAGRHAITIVSQPLPLFGGELRLTVQLLGTDGDVVASTHADAEIEGPRRVARPMYHLTHQAELRRSGTSERLPTKRTVCSNNPVLTVDAVSKSYPLRRSSQFRSSLPVGWHSRHSRPVLTGVDVHVERGEVVGIIGPNGAGKSTLLRCIAGVTSPDSGTFAAAGHVIPMLELGLGFRSDFTGWENLKLAALIAGRADDLAAVIDAVVDFSGVADALDRPVREWSTGMVARLGFSLATHLPADLLLIDEVLAVGDQEFKHAAVNRLRDLADGGTAALFVSHDLDLVSSVCDRVVRLERGLVVDEGPAVEVIERYGGTGWSGGTALGTSPVRVQQVRATQFINQDGDPEATVTARVEADEPSPHIRLEFSLRDPEGRLDPSPMTPAKAALYSATAVVAVDAGALVDPGTYELEIRTGPLRGRGDLHFVVSAVDDRDGEYVAERWTVVHIGGGRRSEKELPATIDFAVALSAHTLIS
ncbi:MAG: ABC transporter ATP-binding protein [Actinomycetes bacterium]